METRSLLLTLAVASILSAAGSASAEPVAADTSEWTCSKCPFDRGYRSEVELGGAYVDESSAKFGDYTGLDEKGGYLIANAAGRASKESGYYLDYQLVNLGLSSREVGIEGGKQGRYEFALTYDRIPHTIWDTTETPYAGNGEQRPHAAPGLGRRRQHRRHDRAAGEPAERGRRPRPRPLWRGRRLLVRREPEARRGLPPRRSQRHAHEVRLLRQHLDPDAASDRRRHRPPRRQPALRGRQLVRAGRLLRLPLRHQGRVAALGQSVHGDGARRRRRPDGARARQPVLRVQRLGRLVQPALELHRGALGRHRRGQAGHGLPALHDQSHDRDRSAALRQPRRQGLGQSCRPQRQFAPAGAPAPARRGHLGRTRQRDAPGRVHVAHLYRPVPDAGPAREPGLRLRAHAALRQRRLRGLRPVHARRRRRVPRPRPQGHRAGGPQRHHHRRLGLHPVPAERVPGRPGQGRRARAHARRRLQHRRRRAERPESAAAQVQHGVSLPELCRGQRERRRSASCRSPSARAGTTATTATTSRSSESPRASVGATAST